MHAYRYIVIALLAAVAAGCEKTPEPEGTDMHEFTLEELQKKKVDDAFTTFFENFNLDSVENPTREIISHSRIAVPQLGTLRYTYTKDGVELIVMDVTRKHFTANLHGGIRLEGTSLRDNGTEVYIDDQRVATLDFLWYEYNENGETKRKLTPVFRFDDGTTYAVTGVLLVEPLIDFLLQNVFSTE